MAHLSENVYKTEIINYDRLVIPDSSQANLETIILSYYPNVESLNKKEKLFDELNSFIHNSCPTSTIAILTSPVLAAEYCSQITKHVHLKLWVAVKLNDLIKSNGKLNQQHAALLIFTKQNISLDHTITRIAYTFCPACEKTTKDYGGKKHLYHEYGTLMSDIWRDVSIDFNTYPTEIIDRLHDVFGISAFKYLNVYDIRNEYPNLNKKQSFRKYNIKDDPFIFRGTSGSMLINDDCLRALKEMPDNSIDFAFCDPPYNIKKKYESWDDGIDIKEYFDWCDKWLSELARILKPGRTLALLNIPQWCIRHYKHLMNELDFQDWIAWEGLSLPVRKIMPSHYGILCFSKGKPRKLPGLIRENHIDIEKQALDSLQEDFCIRQSCITKRRLSKIIDTQMPSNLWWDIHRLKHNSKRVDHPCQLPPNFMYRLLSIFTNENEIVLDPFNGAGTSTLTAGQMNRTYIGIELSDYYHNIARKRHLELETGLNPFRKIKDTPNAKNSRVARVKKQIYAVTKKDLQLEIREICKMIKRIPKREDVIEHSKHPIEYFDNYFIDWGEATAAARTTGMNENKPESIKNHHQLTIFKNN